MATDFFIAYLIKLERMNISKIALLLLFATPFANAGSEIVELACVRDENELTVVGRNKIVFDQELKNSLYAGVELSFEYQMKLGKELVVIPYRLSFDMFSRAYVLRTSDGIQRFADVYSAIAAMEEIDFYRAVSRDVAMDKVLLRFYFDKEKLPFALHWEVLKSPKWRLSSEWRSCDY